MRLPDKVDKRRGWGQTNTMSEEVQTKTVATTHAPYDEAFKRAAVAQWMSGVPAKRVAEGLGITTESLRMWRRRQEAEGTAPTGAAGGGGAKPSLPASLQSAEELRAEVRRLRAQLQSVTNQRDILKKTVGIFVGPNGSVSP